MLHVVSCTYANTYTYTYVCAMIIIPEHAVCIVAYLVIIKVVLNFVLCPCTNEHISSGTLPIKKLLNDKSIERNDPPFVSESNPNAEGMLPLK